MNNIYLAKDKKLLLSLKHDRKDEKDHNLYEKVAVGVFAHVVCACRRGLMEYTGGSLL